MYRFKLPRSAGGARHRLPLALALMILCAAAASAEAANQHNNGCSDMAWPALTPEAASTIAPPPSGLLSWGLEGSLRFFQHSISPLDGPRCVFCPCCSSYARQCLRRYGAWRGFFMTADRLMRCHPRAAGYPRRGYLYYDPPAPTAR